MKISEVTEFDLDKPTPSERDLAEKYRVTPERISRELEKGIKIEMEHTSDRKVAREIALDHLGERLDYYTLIQRLEKTDAGIGLGH